jgi:hypothetical protein
MTVVVYDHEKQNVPHADAFTTMLCKCRNVVDAVTSVHPRLSEKKQKEGIVTLSLGFCSCIGFAAAVTNVIKIFTELQVRTQPTCTFS